MHLLVYFHALQVTLISPQKKECGDDSQSCTLKRRSGMIKMKIDP